MKITKHNLNTKTLPKINMKTENMEIKLISKYCNFYSVSMILK